MTHELIPTALLEKVAQRFKVLAEPSRLQLLNLLHVHGEMTVSDLVLLSGQKQANVSKHLGLLTREGVLLRRKEGLNVYYRVNDPTLAQICELICHRLVEEAEQSHQFLRASFPKENRGKDS